MNVLLLQDVLCGLVMYQSNVNLALDLVQYLQSVSGKTPVNLRASGTLEGIQHPIGAATRNFFQIGTNPCVTKSMWSILRMQKKSAGLQPAPQNGIVAQPPASRVAPSIRC
jgi:hypothetical protein